MGFPLVVLLKIPPWGGIFEKIRVLRGIFWHKSPTNCTATRGIFESRVVIFDNFGIKHVIFPALVLFSHIRCMNLSKTHTKVLSLHFLCSCLRGSNETRRCAWKGNDSSNTIFSCGIISWFFDEIFRNIYHELPPWYVGFLPILTWGVPHHLTCPACGVISRPNLRNHSWWKCHHSK